MKTKTIMVLLCLLLSLSFARPILLIIDSTGSMGGSLDTGMTKLDAAKQAATQIVQNSNDEIALMIYTACDSAGDPMSGGARVVVPFTTDKTQLITEIDKLTADSDTPIADAITEASTYVQTSGKSAAIILLTDGEETCGSFDASSLASIASSHGVTMVNVVGFQLSSSAQTQMQSLAADSGGKYYDANDTASLQQSMQQAYGNASGTGGMCCLPSAFLLAVACGAIIVGRK